MSNALIALSRLIAYKGSFMQSIPQIQQVEGEVKLNLLLGQHQLAVETINLCQKLIYDVETVLSKHGVNITLDSDLEPPSDDEEEATVEEVVVPASKQAVVKTSTKRGPKPGSKRKPGAKKPGPKKAEKEPEPELDYDDDDYDPFEEYDD